MSFYPPPLGAQNACNCSLGPAIGPTLAQTCGGGSFLVFMSILETFLRAQCDIEDPCGRVKSIDRPDNEYDFIVIGGGTAGSVVAARLSEVDNWKVLLIEAGDDEPLGTQIPSMAFSYLNSSIDWRYYTEPEEQACLNRPGRRCFWPRGKVLGGTSVINGMMYIRCNPEDYDDWADLGNPGWRWNEVLKYFLKSEDNQQIGIVGRRNHATGGPLPVTWWPYSPPIAQSILQGGRELGYAVQNLNGGNATGFTIAQMAGKNGVRYSMARAYLRPAAKRPNLHVMLKTLGSKVIIDPVTKRVTGVEVIQADKRVRTIRVRKEVIVSGGAVNSPQILLLSGVGPKNELDEVGVKTIVDLPGVGKNLHNHVSYSLSFDINEADTSPLNWVSTSEYLLYRNGLMASTGLAQITAKYAGKFAENRNEPDTQLFFGGFAATCSQSGDIYELSSSGSRTLNISPVVLHPRSRGEIKLATSNPEDYPKIFARYLTVKRDVDVLVAAVQMSLRLSETAALRKYQLKLRRSNVRACAGMPFGSIAYWECEVRQNTAAENHQSGSCKMGPARDKLAVVDSELSVHGVRGLRVIDASIMPNVVSGNPVAAIVMIAEKGSEDIKRKWGV